MSVGCFIASLLECHGIVGCCSTTGRLLWLCSGLLGVADTMELSLVLRLLWSSLSVLYTQGTISCQIGSTSGTFMFVGGGESDTKLSMSLNTVSKLLPLPSSKTISCEVIMEHDPLSLI